jgi:hypothetical protein
MIFSFRSSSPETFSQQMQDLVNGYQIVVPLNYVPQRLYDSASGGAPGDAGVRVCVYATLNY